MTYSDNSTARFSPEGSYSYTDRNGLIVDFGSFDLARNGQVCVDIQNGYRRCNLFVRRNGILIMLRDKGGRFPVRVDFSMER